MVSGINGFSLSSLNSAQSELKYVATDEFGNITDDAESSLSTDASNVIDRYGNDKFNLMQKVADLITKGEQKETSKETSPNMNLDLDDDIPSPPST